MNLPGSLVAVIFACATCSASAVAGDFKPVTGQEYSEFLNPTNPVRGEAIVGLALNPTIEGLRASQVQVYLPKPFAGHLRVLIASSDGRFRGEGVYEGKSSGAEWVSLQLQPAESNLRQQIKPLTPEVLSIAVRDEQGALYLTRWGTTQAATSGESFRVYVNSRRAEIFLRAVQSYRGSSR